MGDSEDPIGINDKIEILSTDDQRIKAVGELLSSDLSRAILKLLFNDHMTANQIAQKTETSLSLIMYHLKKMQDTGIVSISSTGKNSKSHDMKYYTVDKFAIVILPSGLSEKAKSSKSLHNSFNRIYRFATIGGAALATWFSSQFIQHQQAAVNEIPKTAAPMMKSAPEMAQRALESSEAPQAAQDTGVQMYQSATGEPTTDIYLSIIITLGVVVVGLIIERIIRAYRK